MRFIFLLSLLIPGFAQARLVRSLDFNDGKLSTDGSLIDIEDKRFNGTYVENGVSYVFVNKGWAHADAPTEKRVWLSGSISDSKCIVYETLPTTGITPVFGGKSDKAGNTMDKAQHNLLDSQTVFQRNKLYYVGFSFQVTSDSQAIEPWAEGEGRNPLATTKDAIIYQQWQGSPYSPPFAIALSGAKPDAMMLNFQYRDVATFHPSKTEERNYLRRLPVVRGKWYRFVVASRQCDEGAPRGCSMLRAWIVNGDSYEQLFYHRNDWGYYGAPNPSWSTVKPNDAFQVLVGIYRPRQARKLKVAYDDIKVATSFDDAL